MLTREQIEEIQGDAREKGIAIKALLKEKSIPEHQYFWWKRKYAKVEVPEGVLSIAGGGLSAGMEARASFAASRGKTKGVPTGEHWMSIELRTVSGTDMRKNFNMLSGIVNNDMRQNLYGGDVFVFVNVSNNMMKLLRYEPGGLVIYNKHLDHGRMHLVGRIQEGDPTTTPFEWRRLVDTIQGIIDDPRRRLQRLKVLLDVQMEASLKDTKNI